jgi:hypothetical protein
MGFALSCCLKLSMVIKTKALMTTGIGPRELKSARIRCQAGAKTAAILNIGHRGGTGKWLPVLRSNKRYAAPFRRHYSGPWLAHGWVPAKRFDNFGPSAGCLLGLRPTGTPVAGATPPIGVGNGVILMSTVIL